MVDRLKAYLEESKAQRDQIKDSGPGKYLCAKRFLEIPGLNQVFFLHQEQFGRLYTGIDDGIGFVPTYEAVYFSENLRKEEGVNAERSLSKLIFYSVAMKGGNPCSVEKMLADVPEDMMQYLIRTLETQWAVVTFHHVGEHTVFTVNLDTSELWEQEKSNIDALYNGPDVIVDPYVIVQNGKACIVPGSELYSDKYF